jgi:ribonuclease-3
MTQPAQNAQPGEDMQPIEKDLQERVSAAEAIIGYRFKDKSLLARALTHPSAVEEHRVAASYERLEFMGDALLGAIIAYTIYQRFPDCNEGGLTRIKVSLVSGGMLSRCSEELGFADLIVFGSSEKGTGKRGLNSALENVYEAVTAAIALDGGIEAAQDWVLRSLGDHISQDIAREPDNPKSQLQEVLQVERITPTYELVETEGPPHARTFTCNVLSEGNVIGTGHGHSKKDAEAEAAAHALRQMSAMGRPRRKKSKSLS